MKKCPYCGAEYPDDATECAIDQTPLTVEAPAKFTDGICWTPKSPLGLALTSSLAALLICTGIFFTIGRIEGVEQMRHLSDARVPVVYEVSLVWHHPAITFSLFIVGSLLFTFFSCYNRCANEMHGIVTALITFGIITSLTILPMLVPSLGFLFRFVHMVVPMFMFGMSPGSSEIFYMFAALQIVVGAWLLGWFRLRTPPNNAPEPTPTAT